MIDVVIQKSHNPKKKYDAIINGSKTISFGATGYSDYTLHKDPQRKNNYINRHSGENWTKSNMASAAWMSRFLLWEKPSLKEAIHNVNSKYKDVNFHYKN